MHACRSTLEDPTSLSGATNAALTFNPVALTDAAVYHLIATNAHGSAQTATVPLYVTRRPQTITFNPPVTAATAGSQITLNATASSGLPITYVIVSGAASVSGSVLIGTGGDVLIRATQPGNTTFDVAEPVEFTFSFLSGGLAPFITSPPADQTVNAGTSATLRAAAIGTPAPAYQWRKDGVELAGATGATLTITSTTLNDSGRYSVAVTNLLGTANAAATLTVRAAPVIVSSPASLSVTAGERTTLTVTATGFPAPTYQWRKNGTAIAGATAASLTFASTSAADAGRYEVIATNVLGTATSASAVLTVTTRDFAGTYLGRFTGSNGDFALHIRPDRTAVFLAHSATEETGVVLHALTIDLSGNFSAATVTIAATPRPATVRGAIDETVGAVTGTIPELGLTFAGTRRPSTGAALAHSGYYRAAFIGTSSGRAELLAAPDGETFVLAANGTIVDGARGVINAAGRLTTATSSQATLDLTFLDDEVRGTARTSAGSSATLAGTLDSLAGTQHLANLSIRSVTSPGLATLITGFVVAGTTPKQVLIRAAGPTLAQAPFNVPGVLADPTLQVFRGTTPVAQNDDWGTPAANVATLTAATTRAGAFPFRQGSGDAALLTTLTPGAYSVTIGGGGGTTLAEVYEVLQNNEPPGTRRIVNVSARGLVAPAAPFIAGFVISGPGPQRVLIRGVGPTLGAPPFNVAGVLANPQLTLFRETTALKTNDDWFRDPEAALLRDTAQRAGAFALGANSLDAALLVYLEPGSYTVQVSGPANANAQQSTGLTLLEIYEAAP